MHANKQSKNQLNECRLVMPKKGDVAGDIATLDYLQM
jgi:hypothetical protein